MIACLFMSFGLCAMDEDSNTINLREAMRYERSKKNENEIVICRLNLNSPASKSKLEEHINDRGRFIGSASKDLDAYMKPIVEKVTDQNKKIESWIRTSPFTADDINRADFIVYSIPPSMETERAHHSSVDVFKRFKKRFIIAIREDGEDIVVKDLKEYFPNDTLVIFPRKRESSLYVIFGCSAAIFIGLLCYFKWFSK